MVQYQITKTHFNKKQLDFRVQVLINLVSGLRVNLLVEKPVFSFSVFYLEAKTGPDSSEDLGANNFIVTIFIKKWKYLDVPEIKTIISS